MIKNHLYLLDEKIKILAIQGSFPLNQVQLLTIWIKDEDCPM